MKSKEQEDLSPPPLWPITGKLLRTWYSTRRMRRKKRKERNWLQMRIFRGWKCRGVFFNKSISYSFSCSTPSTLPFLALSIKQDLIKTIRKIFFIDFIAVSKSGAENLLEIFFMSSCCRSFLMKLIKLLIFDWIFVIFREKLHANNLHFNVASANCNLYKGNQSHSRWTEVSSLNSPWLVHQFFHSQRTKK